MSQTDQKGCSLRSRPTEHKSCLQSGGDMLAQSWGCPQTASRGPGEGKSAESCGGPREGRSLLYKRALQPGERWVTSTAASLTFFLECDFSSHV